MYSIKLKMLREKKKLSQEIMASIINVDRSVYGQYEREYTIIPLKHLNKLCNYFNVSLDYIFEFTNVLNYNHSDKETNLKKSSLRIKEFRKNNKITQVKLAKELNIGNGTLADYERARYLISTHALYSICKKYKISADYLLGKTDEPKYFEK